MATEESQPLALDTPVPTPGGWTTVEKLSKGDTVFNRAGEPVAVIGERPVRHGDRCYSMKFSDGEEIVSSAAHQWTFERRTPQTRRCEIRGFSYPEVTVTTEQVAQTVRDGGGTARYRVSVSPPFELPEAELPIHPYIFGLWLGDGDTLNPQFAYDPLDRGAVQAIVEPLLQPYEVLSFNGETRWNASASFSICRRSGLCPHGHDFSANPYVNPATGGKSCWECRRTRHNKGSRVPAYPSLKQRLRDAGVIGHKHIPSVYLRASREQRLALLQGLMDSDGTVNKEKGRALYTTILDELADDVSQLLVTLGYKPSVRHDTSAWRIAFQPGRDPVFRLPRKLARQRPVSDRFARSSYRHVVAVDEVPSVPVRCVTVDDPKHLFLVGHRAIPTHNTGLVYDTIYFNLTEGPLKNVPGLDAGLTRILLPGGGEITPSTASSASKDGGKETFCCLDETHLYNTPDLRRMYKTVTRNLRKRKKIAGTWYLETTTMFAAGQDSMAEATYLLSELIEKGRTRRERLLFDHRWGECDDPMDEAALRAGITDAYGDALAWNDLDGLVDDFYDPRNDIVDSRRYFLNAETETSDAWLAARQWDTCAAPLMVLADRDLVTLGFDGSVSDDATALVACRVLDGHLELLKCEERPEDATVGWQVDQVAVDAAVAAAFERFDVVAFYADPPHWQDYIDTWTTQFGARLRVKASVKHPIEWWTNRPTIVVAALKRFHDAVVEARRTPAGVLESRLSHDGDSQLRRHVLNARRRVSRSGLQVAKEYPGSSRKIDAAMASVLAYEARGDAVAAGFARPRKQRRAVGF